MSNKLRTVLAAMAIAGLSSIASAQTHAGHGASGSAMQHGSMHGQMMGSNATGDAGSRQLHQSMMSAMQDMQRRPMTGDVDKDFVRMMRQHHLQGIEMARIQLQTGDDQEAKRMAQKIIDEQQKDVARLDDWLQRHQ